MLFTLSGMICLFSPNSGFPGAGYREIDAVQGVVAVEGNVRLERGKMPWAAFCGRLGPGGIRFAAVYLPADSADGNCQMMDSGP